MTNMPSATGGPGSVPPPTEVVPFAEPPGWPKGLGVFSIVWGTLGVLCSGCISILAFAGTAFYEWGRQQGIKAGRPDPGAMPDVFKSTPFEILGALVWFVAAALLLAAGIALVRRTAAGRSLHLIYGAVSILSTLISLVAALMKHGAITSWIAANKGDPFLQQPGATMGSSLTFPFIAAVLSLIYPVFILIWFVAVKKRPEDLGSASEELLD